MTIFEARVTISKASFWVSIAVSFWGCKHHIQTAGQKQTKTHHLFCTKKTVMNGVKPPEKGKYSSQSLQKKTTKKPFQECKLDVQRKYTPEN